MSDKPENTPQRPKRPLWRSFLICLSVMLLVCLCLVLGLAWWIWNHQAETVRMVLERVPLPVKATLGDIQVRADGVDISGLVLNDSKTGEEMLSLPSATWKGDWRQVAKGEFGSLKAKDAVVSINLAPSTEAKPNAGSSTASPVRFSAIELQNAQVRVTGIPGLPALSATLDQHVDHLDLRDTSKPSVSNFSTRITNLKTADGDLVLPELELAGSLDANDGILRLTKAEAASIQLKPDSKLLEEVQKYLSQTSAESSEPPIIKGVQITHARLGSTPLEIENIKARIEAETSGFRWTIGSSQVDGDHRVKLSDVSIKPPSGPGAITLPHAEVELSGYEVKKAVVSSPSIHWTPELENWLFGANSSAPDNSSVQPELKIHSLELTEARLEVNQTPLLPYHGQFTVSARLQDLALGPQGLQSKSAQSVSLTQGTFSEHPADKKEPLPEMVRLKQAELSLVPDDWTQTMRLQRLVLDLEKLVISPENTTFLKPSPKTPPSAPATSPGRSFGELQVDELKINVPSMELAYDLAQRVEVKGALKADGKDGTQSVTLSQLKVKAPEFTELPVAAIDEMSASVVLADLFKSRRIKRLSVKGSEFDVNEALRRLLDTPASQDQPTPSNEPAPNNASAWTVEEIALEDNSITLHRLIPGLPSVKFSLNFKANNLPLEPRALVQHVEPQTIELTQLYLRSPFDPFRDVAVMNTVFVHFTLGGLVDGKIDRVDIISPTLMVGEDLFWYIDYYRKYAAGEITDDRDPPRIVSADSNFVKQAVAELQQPTVGTPSAWTLNTLAVTGGKLVIAPKGVPVPGIPQPFPFSFVTTLDKGRFEAELKIPGDNYTWEDLKLEFQNLRGHVLFNLPHRQLDNNLTETFQVDVIRYKQLHIENCHLSVTYDARGIYGNFGGDAYEGYVNGAFNIYNDTSYSWDGWIAGSGVRTTEITQKMTPTYLLLDGKMDVSVVALGNMSQVYQTDLSLKGTTPGTFSITTLNDAIAAIPTDVEGYVQDITRIGIETIRDFKYDAVQGKARFYGREGRGELHLQGPQGSRNIDVNVFDHRWNVKKKPAAKTTSDASE
jgi:hypothetical protein